ncbi:MAG: PQQ-dependent sugar dehydrogenase [Bacteroidota bacterium]
MKKVSFFLALALSLIICCNQKMVDTKEVEIFLTTKQKERATENYQKWCADCHGKQLEHFVNRKWQYGNSQSEVAKIIKIGNEDAGMPAYEETFSPEEIQELAAYILNASQEDRYDFKGNQVQSDTFRAINQVVELDTVLSNIGNPWGMAFLPNGEFLLTIQSGEMYRVSANGEKQVIQGVPRVLHKGQGGLLDVEIHPNFEENHWIYLSYSKPNPSNDGEATTAIFRAKLNGNQLEEGKDIFVAKPYVSTRHHYGSRIEFDREGYLYFSVGDRGRRDNHPQYLTNDCGKIHRIHDDGSIPEDNPFVNNKNAQKSIYSYGHRNPQGVAMNPANGQIWAHEHGPKGGDEVNKIEAANNYGWPVISYGINYTGTRFTDLTEKEGMEQPLTYWVPSIAPCGMAFVTGDRYPAWKGNLLVGSLKYDYIDLCKVKNNDIISQEPILKNIGRVRNVVMGDDGYIYVGVESPGFIFRLMPVE